MNCIYALCFTFCLVGCQGAETFDPFSEILKSGLEKLKTGGNMWYSKRAAFGMFQGRRRNTNRKSSDQVYQDPDDYCMAAVTCTSNHDAIAPTGNFTDGFHFGVENLEAACNNIAQFVRCYDEWAEVVTCGEKSTMIANVLRELQGSLCNTSWAPEILSLLECLSNREMQLRVFGEVMKLDGVFSAYKELKISKERLRSLLCRRQFQSFNKVMYFSNTKCDGNVSSTLCKVFTRLYPYEEGILSMIANVDTVCPIEKSYRCRL